MGNSTFFYNYVLNKYNKYVCRAGGSTLDSLLGRQPPAGAKILEVDSKNPEYVSLTLKICRADFGPNEIFKAEIGPADF